MAPKIVKFKNLYSTDYEDHCAERIAFWFGVRGFFIIAVIMILLEFFRWPLISVREDLSFAEMLMAQGLGIALYSFIAALIGSELLAIILKNLGRGYICEHDQNCLSRNVFGIRFVWPRKTESQIAELKYSEEHYVDSLSPKELHNKRCNAITFMFLLLLACFITTKLIFFGTEKHDVPSFSYPIFAVAFAASIILILITLIRAARKKIGRQETLMWLSVAAPFTAMSVDTFFGTNAISNQVALERIGYILSQTWQSILLFIVFAIAFCLKK